MKRLLIALALVLSGCVSETRIIEAVTDAGYTSPVVLDHYVFFAELHGCVEDEEGFLVEATNPAGKRVKITACSGRIFKGVTIRH